MENKMNDTLNGEEIVSWMVVWKRVIEIWESFGCSE